MPNRRIPWPTTALVGVLILGLLMRLAAAHFDDGLYWPDEVFQTLEPAHHTVFGYGLLPWEFTEGGRSWILPWLFVLVLQPLAWVGVDDPTVYLPALTGVLAVIGVATAAATGWAARRLGVRPELAWLAAAGVAVSAPCVYLGYRALPGPVSALPLILAVGLALPADASVRARRGGAALLGLAIMIRPHVLLLALAVPAAHAARRDWRTLGEAALILGGCALIYGAIDRVTWGSWFHSIGAYLDANTDGGWADAFEAMPASYYLLALPRAMGSPPLMLLIPVLALVGARRSPALAIAGLVFLVAHSSFPHKLIRFVFPLIPLLWLLAALGLQVIDERARGRTSLIVGGLLGAGTVLSAGAFYSLTMGDLGGNRFAPDDRSAFDFMGEVRRLTLEARERPDLCGLAFDGFAIPLTGGQTTLHRDVPVYAVTPEQPFAPGANYRITLGPRGGTVIAREGMFMLVRDSATCVPDPGYRGRAN